MSENINSYTACIQGHARRVAELEVQVEKLLEALRTATDQLGYCEFDENAKTAIEDALGK